LEDQNNTHRTARLRRGVWQRSVNEMVRFQWHRK